MSHIVRFSIYGLAGRKEPFTQVLNRDDNIFFGLNGSGKTLLLKILHSAMSNDTSMLARVPFTAATVGIYSLNYKKVFTRSIRKSKGLTSNVPTQRYVGRRLVELQESFIVEPSKEKPALRWKCAPSKPKGAKDAHWQHQYLPTSRLYLADEPSFYFERAISAPSVRSITEDELDAFFAKSAEHLWSNYSSTVLSAVREAQEKGLANILRLVLSTKRSTRKPRRPKLSVHTAYTRVQKFLSRQGSDSVLGSLAAFERRYNDDPTLQDVVRDIDAVEQKIDNAMKSRQNLQDLITRMVTGNKEVKFTDKSIEVRTSDGKDIGLIALSSGEKHLLRIFVQILLASENTIMIDEPEISMHVDWQKNLLSGMRALNSEAQIILATHSPEIMADVPDDKIFRL